MYICVNAYICVCVCVDVYVYFQPLCTKVMNRLLQIIGLFCKRNLSKRLYSAKVMNWAILQLWGGYDS